MAGSDRGAGSSLLAAVVSGAVAAAGAAAATWVIQTSLHTSDAGARGDGGSGARVDGPPEARNASEGSGSRSGQGAPLDASVPGPRSGGGAPVPPLPLGHGASSRGDGSPAAEGRKGVAWSGLPRVYSGGPLEAADEHQLLSLAQVVSVQRDLVRTAQVITAAAAAMTEADQAVLYVADYSERLLRVAARHGPGADEPGTERSASRHDGAPPGIRIDGTSIVGGVVATGTAVRVRHAHTDPRFQPEADLAGLPELSPRITLLAVPLFPPPTPTLMGGGGGSPPGTPRGVRPLGALVLARPADDVPEGWGAGLPFDARAEELVRRVAGVAASAVARMELYEGSRESRRRLQDLIGLMGTVSTAEDHVEATRAILAAAYKLLCCERVTLFSVDATRSRLVIRESRDAVGVSIPITKGIAGYVATTGRVVNVRDAYNDDRFDPSVDRKTGFRTRSVLCCPVRDARGRIVAVLQAVNRRRPAWAFTRLDFSRDSRADALVSARTSRTHGGGGGVGDEGDEDGHDDDGLDETWRSRNLPRVPLLGLGRGPSSNPTTPTGATPVTPAPPLGSVPDDVARWGDGASSASPPSSPPTGGVGSPLDTLREADGPESDALSTARGAGEDSAPVSPHTDADVDADAGADADALALTRGSEATLTGHPGGLSPDKRHRSGGPSYAFTAGDVEVMEALSAQAGQELTRVASIEALRKSQNTTSALLEVAQAAAVETTIEGFLGRVVSAAYRITDAERVTFFLVDPARDELVVAHSPDVMGQRVKMGRGLVGAVARTGRPINVQDAYQDRRFDRTVDSKTGFRTRAVLTVPVALPAGGGLRLEGGFDSESGVPSLPRQTGSFSALAASDAGAGLDKPTAGDVDVEEALAPLALRPVAILQAVNKSGGGWFASHDLAAMQALCLHVAVAIKQHSVEDAIAQILAQADEDRSDSDSEGLGGTSTSPRRHGRHSRRHRRSGGGPRKGSSGKGGVGGSSASGDAAASVGGGGDDEAAAGGRGGEDMAGEPVRTHSSSSSAGDSVASRGRGGFLWGRLRKHTVVLSLLSAYSNNRGSKREAGVRADVMLRAPSVIREVSWPSGLLPVATSIPSGDSILTWSWDPFVLYDTAEAEHVGSGKAQLGASFLSLLRHLALPQRLSVPEARLRALVQAVCANYHDNAFHNWYHATGVAQACFLLLLSTSASRSLHYLDMLAALVAALTHDVDHPGVANNYLVNASSPLALRHNDDAVLERHHASTAFGLLRRPEMDIFAHLHDTDRRWVRRFILKAILGTDMGRHGAQLKALRLRVARQAMLDSARSAESLQVRGGGAAGGGGSRRLSRSPTGVPTLGAVGRTTSGMSGSGRMMRRAGSSEWGRAASVSTAASSTPEAPLPYNKESEDDRLELAEVLVHTADLSGQAFTWVVARKWSDRVNEEFHAQALREDREGLPTLPFMKGLDDPLVVAFGQQAFVSNVVLPLYTEVGRLLPGIETAVQNVRSNAIAWDLEQRRIERARAAGKDVPPPPYCERVAASAAAIPGGAESSDEDEEVAVRRIGSTYRVEDAVRLDSFRSAGPPPPDTTPDTTPETDAPLARAPAAETPKEDE